MTAWLRRRYGAGPLHLLSLVACLALVGYAVTRIHAQGGLAWIALWWAVSLVAHDLVAWPLYALADRRAVRPARRDPRRLPAVPWINHLRVPAVISGVLLVVSFPLVGRLSERTYQGVTGYTEAPYLGHWLLATGVAFGASAVLYAARLARARRHTRALH